MTFGVYIVFLLFAALPRSESKKKITSCYECEVFGRLDSVKRPYGHAYGIGEVAEDKKPCIYGTPPIKTVTCSKPDDPKYDTFSCYIVFERNFTNYRMRRLCRFWDPDTIIDNHMCENIDVVRYGRSNAISQDRWYTRYDCYCIEDNCNTQSFHRALDLHPPPTPSTTTTTSKQEQEKNKYNYRIAYHPMDGSSSLLIPCLLLIGVSATIPLYFVFV